MPFLGYYGIAMLFGWMSRGFNEKKSSDFTAMVSMGSLWMLYQTLSYPFRVVQH